MSREWAGKDKTWSWSQSLPRKEGVRSRKKTQPVQRPWGRKDQGPAGPGGRRHAQEDPEMESGRLQRHRGGAGAGLDSQGISGQRGGRGPQGDCSHQVGCGAGLTAKSSLSASELLPGLTAPALSLRPPSVLVQGSRCCTYGGWRELCLCVSGGRASPEPAPPSGPHWPRRGRCCAGEKRTSEIWTRSSGYARWMAGPRLGPPRCLAWRGLGGPLGDEHEASPGVAPGDGGGEVTAVASPHFRHLPPPSLGWKRQCPCMGSALCHLRPPQNPEVGVASPLRMRKQAPERGVMVEQGWVSSLGSRAPAWTSHAQ